ncbi:MAG: winged helix-turn-helix domain-containing protein [Candidatus Omnitrophota bacterium]
MIIKIGIVAGDIWHYLDKHGEITLSELISGIDKDKDMILMSLGWLAREGHVILDKEDQDYKISLRKQEKIK